MEYELVLGVDASLTSTGVALIDRKGKIDVGSFGYGGGKSFTLKDQMTRIDYICQEYAEWLGPNMMVVIESPSYASAGGLIYERGGLWTALIRMSYQAGCSVATCPPKTRARWSTGNGASDKKEVRAIMQTMYPKTKFRNYDESDAAALASVGVHYLWNKSIGNTIRNNCLTKCKWPDKEIDDTIDDNEKEEVE